MNKLKVMAISIIVLAIVAVVATTTTARPTTTALGITQYERLMEIGHIPLPTADYFVATYQIKGNLGYNDFEYVNLFVDANQNGFDNLDWIGTCSQYISDPAEGTPANPVMYSCAVSVPPGTLNDDKNYRVRGILSFGVDTGNNPRINPGYGNAITRTLHILP